MQELYVLQCGSATGSSGVHVILFHLLEFLPFNYHDCWQGKDSTYEQVRIDHNPIASRTTRGASIVASESISKEFCVLKWHKQHTIVL